MRAATLAVALLALTATAVGQRRRDREAAAAAGSVKGFIRTSGNKFVDEGCGDFVPVGWNSEFGGRGAGRRGKRARAKFWLDSRCAPFRLEGGRGPVAGSVGPRTSSHA